MYSKLCFIVLCFASSINQILLLEAKMSKELKTKLQTNNYSHSNTYLSSLISALNKSKVNLVLIQKIIWVTIIVIILTFFLFFLMKKFVDLAIRNKIDLLHMKDNSARVITQHFQNQKLISRNSKEEIVITE